MQRDVSENYKLSFMIRSIVKRSKAFLLIQRRYKLLTTYVHK